MGWKDELESNDPAHERASVGWPAKTHVSSVRTQDAV